MAKNILEIVFRTIKEGTGDRETKQALKDLETNFKSMMSVGTAVAGALTAVGAVLVKGYNEWQAYAGQVRDLALASGTTATEASKLLQVLDDYNITAEQVTAATKALTKQGLAPTIDTLATLSDEYLALNSAQERNAFVLKNLGKAGMDYINVLNQGGDAIRAASEDVNASLILSDEQIAKAEQARLAVDAWSDAWQGLKVEVGSAVGSMIVHFDNAAQKMEWMAEAAGMSGGQLRRNSEEMDRYGAAYERGAAMTEFYTRQVEASTLAQEDNTEALKASSDANKSMLSLIGQLQNEYESYTEKNETLRLKLEELNAAQDKVPEWSSKYKDYQTQIEETENEIRKLADEHEMAGKRIAFSLLQQKLASDGLSDTEFRNLLEMGEAWGIYDKAVVDSAMLMDQNMAAMADDMQLPRDRLKEINQAINRIREKNGEAFDFYVNIHTFGSVPDILLNGANRLAQSSSLPGTGEDVAAASGGWGGWHTGGWTLTGEAGPELISPSGYVFPTEATRHLLTSGMLGDFATRAGGGSILLDGVTNITPTNAVNYGFSPINKPKPSGSPSIPSPVVNAEINQAASAAQATTAMADVAAAAVQTSASVQQSSAVQTQQLVSAITVNQTQMADLQRETNRLLAEQAKSLPREMAASMIQVMP